MLVVGAGTRPSDEADAPVGNGRAIGVRCAAEGASVACLDCSLSSALDTLAMVEAVGGRGVALGADVASATDCARAVNEATVMPGGLDGLVLNVCIGLGAGLSRTTPEQWDQTFAVDVRSHFLFCQTALAPLSECARGRVLRGGLRVLGGGD